MRRSTLVFVLIFIVMAGVYYYLKNRGIASGTTDDASLTATTATAAIKTTLQTPTEIPFLFSAEAGIPNNIRLEAHTGEIIELERNAENAWLVKWPVNAVADPASAEAAATQVTSLSIANLVPNVDPKDVGLDVPPYKLTVKFSSGVERIVAIGVLTPTETGYYALNEGEIVIVDRSGIDALINLLANPPYAETLTPSPLPPEATQTSPPSSTPEPVTPTP